MLGHPFPGTWQGGLGPSVHFQPVQWPAGPATPAQCDGTCGDWKPYTRFSRGLTDPRVQDPSNGGTAPQNYVNVSSSCSDKAKPSIYYYLHKAVNPADDVVMFRWRVEQAAHNYATGSNPGNYSATNPWSSAQWTVLFNIDGSGYRSLAAHLNGSSGSPAEPIDMLAGIWSNTTDQTIDYTQPNVHLLSHNPTAFVGPTGKLMNFHGTLSPDETWANGAAETVWDYGTTRATLVTNSPCTEYFIDYQIPVAMLDASGVGGPALTRDTPISMLFCTANSLSNPFQKDCALNKTWNATSTAPAPFGDYLSFNKDEPYQQPIISSVSATAPTSCPGSYTLTTKIQDALAVQNGVVVNTLKSVQFYYWYDRNGDGAATAADTGSAWTRITPTASLVANTLNTFTASWNATTLPKGKYLIGVQAVDDATILDDGMTSNGIDNRTFSYLSGDTENEIYVAGIWATGQQAIFPSHSPSQSPVGTENWYGNPSVTGMQVALVGTAINACGVAPTISLGATPSTVAVGGAVGLTLTVTNPGSNSSAITVSSVGTTLPTGFTYTNSTSSGTNGLPSTDPTVSGQQLTWTLGAPITLNPGASAALSFSSTAASSAGSYSATAVSTTSFGDLVSTPASVVVDSARVSLSMTPSANSIAANGSTALVYTLRYSNDSGVAVTSASISNVLPAGVTYSACSGGTSCNNSAGTVTWSLGSLGAGVSGTATLTITVPSSYSSFSLANTATLLATAPDASTVSSTASTTVAVTGVSLPGTPRLKLTNIANVTSVAPSGSIVYTIAYVNEGTASASNVVITDSLATGTTYTSNTGGGSHSSGVVTWNIGTVAAGASGSVTVTVGVAGPSFTAANPTTNTATVSWTGGTPVTASAIVGVTGQSCSSYYFKPTTSNVGFDGTKNIAVTSPVTVSGDTGAKVSATVTSSGYTEMLRFYQDPQTANDVTFSGNLTTNIYIDRNNGQGMSIQSTVYDYNSTTGAKSSLGSNITNFTGSTKGLLSFTLPLSGTLVKGHRLLWVYEATASNNPVPVEFQYGGTVANGYSSGSTAAISYANYCVTPPASLTLTNTVSSVSVTENTTPVLTYTLRYSNAGSSSATNSVLIGALPTGFTGCQYSTDNNTWNSCSSAGGSPPSHSFSLGSIAGAASGTVYVRGNVPAGTTAGGSLVATSSIGSDQTSSLSATATTAIGSAAAVATPGLTLSLSANRTTAGPGNSVVYTITAINTGSATATNVVVSNTVPANGYYTYASCTGSCGAVGNVLTWPPIASLAAGASQSFTYTMGVATSGLPSGITSISDNVQGSGNGGLSATSNNTAVEINGNPTLVLLNNASPSSGLLPGNTITYTLTLGNSGSSSADSVVVTNPIPANTTYLGNITASVGSGSFDTVNNRVIFNVGNLASGASATLNFDVAINSPLPSGPTTITSTATADSSNAAQQIASANASASATPVLAISKSAPSSVAYPSAMLTAAANGTTIFVNRTDQLHVNQFIKVGSQVARVVSLGAKSIVLDASITATGGSAVNGSIEFTVAYGNIGNADATSVVVAEVLDTGFGYYSSSPSATMAPVSGASGSVGWNIGTLAAGNSSTVQVIAFPLSSGSLTNNSSVSANNAVTATTSSVTRIGGLTVTKSSSTPVVSAGANATYSIVVSNSLGSPVSPVTVMDKLPQGFSYAVGSALVGGAAIEPTFAVDDNTSRTQPTWGALTIPANGSLTITFNAQVANTAGAAVYQNELDVDAPGGTGVSTFDPLLTTNEDVSVLAAASGMLKGYVFKRASGNALSFDPLADTPLAGVRVELHKTGADCNNPVGGNCVVVYTDSNGYFEHAMAAEAWIVSVKENTGDLPNGWFQLAGANDDTVNVPDQGVATDYNGFTSTPPTTHTVTGTAGPNGSISPGSRTVIDGDTTTFSVTASGGYFIDTVTGCGGSLSGGTYTTGAITGACTVNATFSSTPPVTHTVSTSASAGGTIAPGSRTVNDGNTTSFTITENTGYTIGTVSGCGGSLSGNTYTTGTITGACTVSASFNLNSYTVTATAGTGGTAGPASKSVSHGNTTNITVTPNSGFAIQSVTGCSGNLSGNTYTTGAITGACTVNATFSSVAPTTYLVSTNAGTGGSIGPSSSTVNSGAIAAFTVTPNSGYGISTVTGCGGTLSGSTYTTAPIGGACTVSATFAINTYTVTAIAGTGGTISPGTRTVNHNATTTFTVSPAQNFGIASVSGCGGSLSGNTYTTGSITAACTVTASFAQNGPRFDPAPPVSINARALFTDVPLNIAPRAVDGNGTPLTVTLVGETKYRPGRYTLTWKAVDGQGREMTAQQQFDVWPMVTVSEDIVVGFGNVGEFRIQLNGDSPQYPFDAAFTVSGDGGLGTLHNLAPKSVTFASGTEQTVQFDALTQGTSMPTRRLKVTLDPALNIGARGSLDISLVSENAAPMVQVQVTQAGRVGALVSKDGGPIVLHATIDDPNVRDTHTLEWTPPRGAAVQTSANGLDVTVDPQSLSAGVVEFGVSATDSGTPQMTGRNKVVLAVRSSSVQLDSTDSDGDGIPDITEGWGDSGNGIPQYLARPMPRGVLPEDVDVTDKYLVEGDPNVHLRIGAYSQLSSRGARLTSTNVASFMTADAVINVGGIFDVEAVELGSTGTQVRVVIPQRQPIPSQPIYRLWDGAQAKWTTFVENGTNLLSSAPGEPGYCPPAGSSAYSPGLTTGHLCVQVTLEDGGANDSDKLKNAGLAFSGGIGQRSTSIVTGTSSGGGGSMGNFAALLCMLSLLRLRAARWSRIVFAAFIGAFLSVGLSAGALAADAKDNRDRCANGMRHCFYVGGTLGLVRNSDGAAEMDERLRAQGYVTSTSLSGQSRLGFGLFGGYRWERLAAELSYTHLGRMDTIVAGNTPVDATYLRAVSAAHPRSGEGPQLSALYHLPINEKWEAFGRGGYFYWKNTLSAEGFGQYDDLAGRRFDPFVGLGIQWHKPEKKWSIKGELQAYKLDSETVLMVAAEFTYRVKFSRD